MPTTAQLVEKLPTTESRGEALLDAKKKRLEQETRLGQVRHRVGLLADEAERIKREIEEARARTRERMELAERTDAIKKVGSQTRAWVDAELEERRKAVAEQRKVAKQAIEAKRLAILEARHADFVAKKQEAAKMRITIINARAMKQQQKKTQMEFVRAQSVTARQRMKTFEEERQKAISSHFAVDRLQEEAEARESMAQIQRLAKEEERLLSAVVQQHAKHRSEFDSLMKAKPAYARGLTPNPAPLGLTPPLSPESAAELGALERTKERLEIELNPLEQAADLSISGLGWVSLGALASLRKATDENAMRMVIDVWVPKGVQVSLRPPMPIAGLPNEPPPPPEENWKDSVFEDRYSDRFSDREYGYD